MMVLFFPVCHEHQFKDKYLFYRFREDDQGVSTVPSSVSKKECEDDLQEVFLMLAQIGPDAMMRMILRKVYVFLLLSLLFFLNLYLSIGYCSG